MHNANEKIKTPGHDTAGQTRHDNQHKAGERQPHETVKPGVGSKEAPAKFEQSHQGGFNKPQQK